ncbi:PLP-dependent aminotransferase family protein [Phenylobacterium sp.]|uniref:aminotransferase-like domain-containing protein n=1 Tax=Phenylobacterium sp. TaxID=1871053 RepID=UPI002E3432C1|nr:PLP-dependent aminotransferase family protein [Phenylobacterium sp.]HEX4710143.1 PLP-dependent aminotransferase family protein [Phenylobacterium sp.]
MADYLSLVERIGSEIREGVLRAGDRLPPQREFAYAHGIAASTAGRVYRELVRRGLAVGEVGRGTFVRLGGAPASQLLAEPTELSVDLELNFPQAQAQEERLIAGLAQIATRRTDLVGSFQPASARGTAHLRQVSAAFLSRAGWSPDPDRILFAGSGKQAIAATLSTLASRGGERIGVEALTYPFVKSVARRLSITLVPLEMDEEGLSPEALLKAHRAAPLAGVYLQPVLHNPLGVSMGRRRRSAIVDLLESERIIAVEDAVYAFLDPDAPPLAALAPGQVIVVDSLSKRLSPGLSIGFAIAPPDLTEAVRASLQSGAWVAPGLNQALAGRWMSDGMTAAFVQEKQAAARQRQALARERLGEFELMANPNAFHVWLKLPAPWRAEAFVAAAARRRIALSPGSAFAVAPGHAPNAVRIALSAPPIEALSAALLELAALLRQGGDADLEA